jgi:glutamine synthetase adenylyltransferase
MSDSNTAESVVTLSSKAEYENSINLSQHVSQAKTISEMVLDAFQSTRESDQIRELRAAIRHAHDSFDDDKAYELMGELKQLKDAEAADIAALEDLSSKFSIGRILSSFKDDPAFQEIVYGLALKVLNQTTRPSATRAAARARPPRPRKKSKCSPSARTASASPCPCAPRARD